MSVRSLLWVDLRTRPSKSNLCSSLPKRFAVHRVCRIADVARSIQKRLPWAACFEFDNPDARGLQALAEIKQRYSSLPIILLTEPQTKGLSSWAFRCCVWDHLVKPLSVRNFCDCLTKIDGDARPAPSARPAAGMASARVAEGKVSGTAVARALSYVEANYAEKLRMETAAKLCNLSPFQFSRSFKKENGLTFRDFVVKLRIQRAAQLMKESGMSVTEAAFGVGFNDSSYFARMFRRELGVCPSHYRAENEPSQLPLFPQAGDRQKR
jgi:AraC-like DNA-binding protein